MIQLDEVTVTGTHIRGDIPVGASLSTYDREYFDKFGIATVDSLARYMLENFSGADSLATLNTNGNVGSLQQGQRSTFSEAPALISWDWDPEQLSLCLMAIVSPPEVSTARSSMCR